MTPQLHRVGVSQSPVVVVDDFTGDVGSLVASAVAMAPFPRKTDNAYPGLRRVVTEADGVAYDRMAQMLRDAAPFIGGAFDLDGFDLVEASFSMVTAAPATLAPEQRAPHFDSTDPRHIAMMLYLSDTPRTGTAFYRQRATGIETVDDANIAAFIATAKAQDAAPGYVNGSDAHYEQIGSVDGVPDRLVLYRGQLLHSGIIPPHMDFSPDPRRGRLTANIFIQGH
jgi:hypothetical protein